MANGHPKAAGVLRRHVAQKESTAAGTSLDEIYSRWLKDAKETSASPVKEPGQSESSGEDEETSPPSASQTSLNLSGVNPRRTQPVLKSPVAKKPGASDTESTDDSDIIENTPQPPKILSTPKVNSVSATGKASKMVRPEQPKKKTAHDDDSDSECDIQPSQVPFFTPTRTARKNPVATDKDAVSTDSSDGEETGLSKQVQAKRSPGKSILAKGTTIKSNQALHSKTAGTNQVTAPEKTRKGSSTDSDSTSDSDSSKKAPAKGIPVKTGLSVSAKTTPAPKTPAAGKKAESSDDSDSEEEVVAKTVLSKAAPINPAKSSLMSPTKATPMLKTPAVGKKDVMSDSGSSEDSDSEEEAPVKAALVKGAPSKPSQPKLNTTATPKAASTGKKAESSDSGSSDDSASEEEAPVKAALAKGAPSKPNSAKPSQGTPTKAAATTKSSFATKKDASSDDSDSEEEAPVKTVSAKGTPSKPSLPKLINTTATPKAASTGKKAESSDSESSDNSDSDEEAPDSTLLAKGPPAKPSQPPPSKQGKGNLGNLTKPFQAAPNPVKSPAAKTLDMTKKATSSERKSNTILPKGVPNKTNQPTPNQSTAALKVPAVATTQDSSSSESSDETDREEKTPTKKVVTAQPMAEQVKGKAAAKVAEPTKGQGMSNGCAAGQKVSAAAEHVDTGDSSSSEEEEASQSLLAPKPPPKKSSAVSKKTPAEKGKRQKDSVPSGSKTTANVTPASPWTVTKTTPVVPPASELDSDVTDIERDPRASTSKVVAATPKGKKGVKSGDQAADSPLAKVSSTKKTPPAAGSGSEAPAPLAKPKRGKDKSERDDPKPKKSKIGSPEPSKAVVPPPIPPAGGDSESDSDSSLDVEKWKRLALHLTDSDIAKMDAIASVDLGSRTISVSGKSTKEKEKNGKAKAGGNQSHGTASGTKKAAPPTSAQLVPSVTDDQSAEAKAKPAKRPLFTATGALYGHKTSEKKQKLDKDGTKQTSAEKRKDVKEKKNMQQMEVAKRKERTADVNLPAAVAKLPEEKSAKKNKLKLGKKNLTSTPSKTLQNDSRDTEIQSPLSDSGQKKKKKSSKNK